MSVVAAWLWQGCLIAVIAAGVLRALPRTSAATRHLVLWCTLLCIVSLPLLQVPGTGRQPAGAAPAAAAAPVANDAPAPSSAPISARRTWTLPAPPDWALALALGAWLGMVLLSAGAVLRGVRHVRRLSRGGEPLPAAREARLAYWAAARQSGRPTRLRVSPHVAVPCAVGLGLPTILVPRDLLDAIDDRDLDLLVLHERAHLVRYDDWTRLLEACVVAVAGWHPAVRWVAARIDAERESACDDHVLAVTGAPRAYAACLAATAEAVMPLRTQAVPLLAPGALLTRGELERRVRRVMDSRHRPAVRASLAAASAGAVAFALLALVLARTAPAVAFVPTVQAPDEGVPAMQALDVSAVPVTPPAGSHVVASSAALQRDTERPLRDTLAATRRGTPSRRPSPGGPTRRPETGVASSSPVRAAVEPPDLARSPSATPPQVNGSLQPHVELPSALPIDAGVRPVPLAPATVQRTPVAVPDAERSPWADVAHAGVDVGSGAKKAGQAVAGFFSRAGQAVAGSF